MSARKSPADGALRAREDLDGWFRDQGLEPRWWSNEPRESYGWHDHPYHKVLFCSEGSIVFHLRDGDVEMEPGDRLDIEPRTEHSATVGPEGVTCVEAPRDQ
ncbi:MAG: cupin domain-containing protein [Actinomycetota bacterium]